MSKQPSLSSFIFFFLSFTKICNTNRAQFNAWTNEGAGPRRACSSLDPIEITELGRSPEFEDSPLSKRRVVVAARIRARQWYLGNLEIQWKLSRVEGSTIAEEVAAAAAAMASGAARSRQREDGCLRVHTHTHGREGGGGRRRRRGGRRDRVEEYYTCRCSGVLTPNSFFNVT